MMKLLPLILLSASCAFLFSCHSPQPEKPAAYRVVLTEPESRAGGDIVTIRAVLDNDSATGNDMRSYLLAMYEEAKAATYKNKIDPTKFLLYLYRGERKAMDDKSAWVAMLSKMPTTETEIEIRQEDPSGNEYAGVVSLAKEKGVDLCDMYYEMKSMIASANAAGDAKYPSDYRLSMEYADKEKERGYKEIMASGNMPDSLTTEVFLYGQSTCK